MKRERQTKTIDHLERMNNSYNGNPRFRVYFTDGTSYRTSPDAMFCYGIENPEYRAPALVEIELDGRENIVYAEPVKD